MSDWKTYKFKSGLTIPEAEALVDKLVATTEDKLSSPNPEFVIHMLKHHLVRAVRDHKIERDIVSACAAD
jgi:hypothetical protein